MSTDWQTRLEDELEPLRRTRDELRVQLHLGAAEAKDAWEKLEHAWQKLEQRAARVREATEEASEEIEDATDLLLDELTHGYERIKQAL